MPKADNTNTTPKPPTPPQTQALLSRASRRQLFNDIGHAAVVGGLDVIVPLGVNAAEHPDGGFLRILARFARLEETSWPVGGTGSQIIEDEDDRARLMAPLRAKQAALINRACVLCATALDGLRARAQALMIWNTELRTADAPIGCFDDCKFATLIRDLVGGAVP